jgi:hypothetical protein
LDTRLTDFSGVESHAPMTRGRVHSLHGLHSCITQSLDKQFQIKSGRIMCASSSSSPRIVSRRGCGTKEPRLVGVNPLGNSTVQLLCKRLAILLIPLNHQKGSVGYSRSSIRFKCGFSNPIESMPLKSFQGQGSCTAAVDGSSRNTTELQTRYAGRLNRLGLILCIERRQNGVQIATRRNQFH